MLQGRQEQLQLNLHAHGIMKTCIDSELPKPVLMKFSVPQGSVLVSKYFTIYRKPVGSISKNRGLVHHLYAKDSLLYLSFKPTDNVVHTEALCRVESCLNDVVAWMHDNMLKLNTNKTEVIVCASQRNANFIEYFTVTVGESEIKASSFLKTLALS